MSVYRVGLSGDTKNNGWVTSPTANQSVWSTINKPQTNPTAPALTPLIQDTGTNGHVASVKAAFFDIGPDEVITQLVVNVYLSTGTSSGGSPLSLVLIINGKSGTSITDTVNLGAGLANSWQTVTHNLLPSEGIYPDDISGKQFVNINSQAALTGTNKAFACYLSVVTVGGQPKIFPNRPSQAVRTAAFR